MAQVKRRPKKRNIKNNPVKGLSIAFDIIPEWYVGLFFYSDQFSAYSDLISWAGQYKLPQDSNGVCPKLRCRAIIFCVERYPAVCIAP